MLGVLGQKSKLYLEQKLRLKYCLQSFHSHQRMRLSNIFQKFDENTLVLITLPTPKQEIIAEAIARTQNNYKIMYWCIIGYVFEKKK